MPSSICFLSQMSKNKEVNLIAAININNLNSLSICFDFIRIQVAILQNKNGQAKILFTSRQENY